MPPVFEKMNDANIYAFKIHKIAFNTENVDVFDRERIILTISIICNDINSLIRSEEQKN